MTGAAVIVQGNALHLPLPDESVDLVVTSPPYAFLRAYNAGPQEIGQEATPQAYLQALWAATAEMVRVLKPSGSIFVNLGDKYASDNRGSGYDPKRGDAKFWPPGARSLSTGHGTPAKSLMLLPERYRIGCVDRLGLIARAVIVWDKPNGLPESATDRVARKHEDWVHLTRFPRYYSATDEIREAPSSTPSAERRRTWRARVAENWQPPEDYGTAPENFRRKPESYANSDHPLGKLPGSVWSIPSEPLRLPDHLGVQHYAAFPSEWPRRLILGFSPPGICLDCGHGRVPVVERGASFPRDEIAAGRKGKVNADRRDGETLYRVAGWEYNEWRAEHPATILGYACGCTPHTNHPGTGGRERNGQGYAEETGRDAHPHGGVGTLPRTGPWREYHLDRWQAPPTRPSVILDPFAGTFTTVMVARALDRIGIGVDLSMPYCKAGRWRVRYGGAKAVSRTNLERQGSLL